MKRIGNRWSGTERVAAEDSHHAVRDFGPQDGI
jgi:hypothetical protein